MARAKKNTCEDLACFHLRKPRVDAKRPPLAAISTGARGGPHDEDEDHDDDDDDDALALAERRIVAVVASNLEASRGVFTDCIFERCDLANGKWRKARLQAVSFVDCRLVGADFSNESWLEDVTFDNCILDMATFGRATLRRVVFTKCRLDGAAFGGSSLDRVAFPESALDRCDFTGASAPGGAGTIDFRGASIAGAAFDARLVRALVVRPEDAGTIVSALGATVTAGEARTACKI